MIKCEHTSNICTNISKLGTTAFLVRIEVLAWQRLLLASFFKRFEDFGPAKRPCAVILPTKYQAQPMKWLRVKASGTQGAMNPNCTAFGQCKKFCCKDFFQGCNHSGKASTSAGSQIFLYRLDFQQSSLHSTSYKRRLPWIICPLQPRSFLSKSMHHCNSLFLDGRKPCLVQQLIPSPATIMRMMNILKRSNEMSECSESARCWTKDA